MIHDASAIQRDLDKEFGGIVIGVKGAGDLASGIACRLYHAGFRQIYMMETLAPMAVRRSVSFCEAVHDKTAKVEGITAVLAWDRQSVFSAWDQGCIAVVPDPQWRLVDKLPPQVLVDAILAKQNLGTSIQDAPKVIGCGPGFIAGKDVHLVVETQRGHDLGRVIAQGSAIPDTGIPGSIQGYTVERVLRSPVDGVFKARAKISDRVGKGQIVGLVADTPVRTELPGILRGLIRSGTRVTRKMKIGDVDPRAEKTHCFSVSDKARAIGGGVLEAVLRP